eukprot:356062-Chlamydomonas_euryale.AAC.4
MRDLLANAALHHPCSTAQTMQQWLAPVASPKPCSSGWLPWHRPNHAAVAGTRGIAQTLQHRPTHRAASSACGSALHMQHRPAHAVALDACSTARPVEQRLTHAAPPNTCASA